MTLPTVAMVLVPASRADLLLVPHGSPAWVASTPEMQDTLVAARAVGLAVTELYTNGADPNAWFFNHLDSLDQHHNELSQRPPYSQLLVFGVSPSPEVSSWLQEFGFIMAKAESFGLSASKRTSVSPAEVGT